MNLVGRNAEQMLSGTPYLVEASEQDLRRFAQVSDRAATVHARAEDAAASIAEQAKRVLPQFEMAIRSDLVSESDRMEGIDTSPAKLRRLIQTKTDLLDMEAGAFLRFLRDDERLLSSLGLYRAYAIADDWARAEQRPREFELRSLHALVMPELASGGRYKDAPNKIHGSDHQPTAPWDVGRDMADLASWFERGTGDAVLDAAVVHAWVAHIHPFDDGNGRMARLLANLALIQAHYPPLLLRSGSDRGQYLDALAASDEGDILPLYDLFVSSLRRVVRTMEKPSYVEAKIRGDLLQDVAQRHQVWLALVRGLLGCLEQRVKRISWGVYLMGYPTLEHFDLLERRNSDGNCWFAKVRERGEDRWLLWFGYQSDQMTDLVGKGRPWPSIFLAKATERPDAVHPFEPSFACEFRIAPGSKPVTFRKGFDIQDVQIEEAAGILLRELDISG